MIGWGPNPQEEVETRGLPGGFRQILDGEYTCSPLAVVSILARAV